MDVNVASQYETTQESGSSQDNVPDQVFLNVLEPNRYGRVRRQPPTVTLLYYYDSKRMDDLRRRVKKTEEVTCTVR